MCFVWIWEQTEIISLYTIKCLVWDGVCLLRGTDWVFIYNFATLRLYMLLNAKRSWFNKMTQYTKRAPWLILFLLRHILLAQTKKTMIDCAILFCSQARHAGRLQCQKGHLLKLGYSSQLSLRLLKSLLKQTEDGFVLLLLANRWFVLSYRLSLSLSL